jgi:hypothetical protein
MYRARKQSGLAQVEVVTISGLIDRSDLAKSATSRPGHSSRIARLRGSRHPIGQPPESGDDLYAWALAAGPVGYLRFPEVVKFYRPAE